MIRRFFEDNSGLAMLEYVLLAAALAFLVTPRILQLAQTLSSDSLFVKTQVDSLPF